jgi:hypothetical protein
LPADFLGVRAVNVSLILAANLIERKIAMSTKLPKRSPGRTIVLAKGKPKAADKRPRTIKAAAMRKAARKPRVTRRIKGAQRP